MNKTPDYYRILQVHPAAEPEVIQAAYRRLARKYHPDVGYDQEDLMQAINEAYEVLSDGDRRAQYDRWYRQHVDARSQTTMPPASWWRILLPVVLTLIVLTVLVLDVFRLGLRGFPEITVVLVLLGWLIYHFGGWKRL